MPQGIRELLAEASANVPTLSVAEVRGRLGDEHVALIDVRDAVEIAETGTLPGAVHASRGMLEFHIDPASPYHKEVFASGRELVFYCKSGGRSMLAAERARAMGVPRVASMTGGMQAWLEAGGPVSRE